MWKEILDNTEAVLFDLDGTLVDSMWIWRKIDEDYFAEFGMELPENYQKEIEGLSFYETALFTRDKYMPDRDVEDLMNDWNKMAYDHYANKVPPKEGIKLFLDYLKGNGIKIGIATSNSSVLCNATLENNGLLEYFDAILTGEECGAGKPSPDVYINTAASLGIDPEKCLVFEDICNGITAGKRAGMTVVAVYDEYSHYQWEEKCNIADHFIMSYKEITDEIY
jgi:16S rRNA pseudouridine516 synthase